MAVDHVSENQQLLLSGAGLVRRHVWVEFVGSLLCSERFPSGTSVFPSGLKNQHLI